MKCNFFVNLLNWLRGYSGNSHVAVLSEETETEFKAKCCTQKVDALIEKFETDLANIERKAELEKTKKDDTELGQMLDDISEIITK